MICNRYQWSNYTPHHYWEIGESWLFLHVKSGFLWKQYFVVSVLYICGVRIALPDLNRTDDYLRLFLWYFYVERGFLCVLVGTCSWIWSLIPVRLTLWPVLLGPRIGSIKLYHITQKSSVRLTPALCAPGMWPYESEMLWCFMGGTHGRYAPAFSLTSCAFLGVLELVPWYGGQWRPWGPFFPNFNFICCAQLQNALLVVQSVRGMHFKIKQLWMSHFLACANKF